MNKNFTCSCGGNVRKIDNNTVYHVCKNKYTRQVAPFGAYYDRVQISPKLTGGVIKYNWFLRYDQ